MYNNNILNFQNFDNFKCLYKKVWKPIEYTTYMCHIGVLDLKLQTNNWREFFKKANEILKILS